MSAERDVTLLVIDFAGTHQLFEQMGAGPANRLIGRLLGGMGQIVEYYGGRVIKTVGDSVLSEFSDPSPAVTAAVHTQREMARHGEANRFGLGVRLGLHHGPVTEEVGDLFGPTVEQTNHITALAKREQIVGSLLALAWADMDLPLERIGAVQSTDPDRPIPVARLLWREMRPARATTPDGIASNLQLSLGSQRVTVSPENPAIELGRQPTAAFDTAFSWVSRNHATIVMRDQSFFLIDESTNGTYLIVDEDDDASTTTATTTTAEHSIGSDAEPVAGSSGRAAAHTGDAAQPGEAGAEPAADTSLDLATPSTPTGPETRIHRSEVELTESGWIGLGWSNHTRRQTAIRFRVSRTVNRPERESPTNPTHAE